jgi:hypothetical protein
VACKNTTKRRYERAVYRCAYNHKREDSICTNKVQLRQDILDSAILHAMNEALDERVLEASVAAALEGIRSEQARFPDQRVALERELSLIQTRLQIVEIQSGQTGGGHPLPDLFRPTIRVPLRGVPVEFKRVRKYAAGSWEG